MKTINILTWGNGHKLYRKNIEYLYLLAYEKAFYFEDVKINNVPIQRYYV